MRRPSLMLLFAVLLAYVGVSVTPAWTKVRNAKHGRDFATYHYAAAEVLDGGDPYATKRLSKRARTEGTRKSVHPYFYPPPFLLSVMWSPAFDLPTSYRVWFWLNQGLVLLCLAMFRRWFRAPWVILGTLLLTFTPITDNAKMGQANLMVLAAAVAGLWLKNGALVGVAAMAKMSPALYLAGWAARGAIRPIAMAVAVAVISTLMALPWIDAATQIRFYTEVLPGFSTGNYHGLTVRIGLPANHSIPDLFNQLWPGPDAHTLSLAAGRAAKACTLALLVPIVWVARRSRDRLGTAAVFGALTVLLLVTPVYTYEHHLVMAMFPAVVVGTALMEGRLGRWGWGFGMASYFFTAWPLYWLRPLQQSVPNFHWVLQESKFFGLMGLGVLCVVVAINSPRRS